MVPLTSNQTHVPAPHAIAGPLLATLVSEACRSRLFLVTTISAMTGQVTLLAAAGALGTLAGVATVGLTVIAGVGAFTVALHDHELVSWAGRRRFAAVALVSIAVNVAAAAVGVFGAGLLVLEWLPTFTALALAVVAFEVGTGVRARLPGGLPLALAVAAVGLAVEVLA